MKGPLSPQYKELYNFEQAAKTVHKMVLDFDMQHQVMVSSFVPEIVTEMARCLELKHEFMLCRLLNRKEVAETDYTPQRGTDGINISATYLTKEIVDQTHALGKTVGVYLSRAHSFETKAMYDQVFSLGVDFVYFDGPLPAMEHRG